jgi:hypothetical protein
VTPDDDGLWPACDDHGGGGLGVKHWCEWTLGFMRENKDAAAIQPGLRYCVPVLPAYDIYAEVSIDARLIANMSAELNLVKTDPFDQTNEELIQMGLWTIGEGRFIIASTLLSWAENAPAQCSSVGHALEEEMQVKALRSTEMGVKMNGWFLAYHKSCKPCYDKMVSKAERAKAIGNTGGSTWSATSFGVDPKDFRTSGATSSASTSGQGGLSINMVTGVSGQSPNGNFVSRDERTRQALADRFGNNPRQA